MMDCCKALLNEWRLGMWSTADANGKTIDLERTFRPCPHLLTGAKLSFLVWSLQVLIATLIDFLEPKSFWLAYLTHWGLLLSVLYQTLSFSRMILPVSQEPVGFLTRFAWGTFTTAANVEVIITLLYWTLDYKGGPVTYLNIMKHGIIMLEIWIDGFIINRIPIRLKQVLWVYILSAAYLTWTGIQAASGIGNPNRNDSNPATDDDAIYGVMNWTKRPAAAAVVTILILVIGIPILILATWYVSTIIGRRYIENDDADDDDNPKDPSTKA